MLDIVITHHKEPWAVCRNLLQSLDMQRCVRWEDIRVTIVNDGGHRLQVPELDFIPKAKQFRQVDIPHGGVSAARNAGIANATEPWVMFCDCDDAFHNIYALEDIMRIISTPASEDYDILWTRCVEETEDQMVMTVQDYRVFVFCHGKIYRRNFLLANGLFFDERLTFNEDSCFNGVAIAHTQNSRIGAIRSSSPVYAWIRRPGSVTTQEGRKDEGTYCHFKRNLIVTEANRLHRPDQYPAMVTRTAYDVYYVICSGTNSTECELKILEEFIPWFRKRRDVFGAVDPAILDQIREISRIEMMEIEIHDDSHEEIREWLFDKAEE